MTKREQTDEMTKERNEIKDIMKLLDKCVSLNPMYKSEVASVLYGNNYRKAEEVRKETAKEILQEWADDNSSMGLDNTFVKNIAKKYGVEVKE